MKRATIAVALMLFAWATYRFERPVVIDVPPEDQTFMHPPGGVTRASNMMTFASTTSNTVWAVTGGGSCSVMPGQNVVVTATSASGR